MSTSSVTSQRTLHLVDLENLAGDPCAAGAALRDTFARYLAASAWQAGDHVIIASNPCVIRDVAFELPVPCNVHACRGLDGADTMLLALATPHLVARRYARLVIGSGDGAFAALATAVRDLHVPVLVIARADGCSYRLRAFDHLFVERDRDAAAALVLAA